MKTIVIIACFLTLTYAVNPEKAKEHYDYLENCAQELNKNQDDPEVIYCVLQKEGLIDEEGKYVIDKGLAVYDNLISDETKRNEAKDIIRNCYDEVGYDTPGDKNEKTFKGIQCAMGVQSLLDKYISTST